MYSVRLVGEPGKISDRHFKAIRRMDSKCFPSDNPVKIEGRYWWIVFKDGKPAGYAGLDVLKTKGFFCRAGVIKSHRRRGLHQRLIRVRLRKAELIGLSEAITYAALHNTASANSLFRAGMALYWPDARWAGTAYYFRKVFK